MHVENQSIEVTEYGSVFSNVVELSLKYCNLKTDDLVQLYEVLRKRKEPVSVKQFFIHLLLKHRTVALCFLKMVKCFDFCKISFIWSFATLHCFLFQ